jgi:hypothetical protein
MTSFRAYHFVSGYIGILYYTQNQAIAPDLFRISTLCLTKTQMKEIHSDADES